MSIYRVCLIFFVVFYVQSCLAEDVICSDSVCEGIEGNIIVIPCGSDELYPDNVTYTYFNQSSKSILLSNSNDYLMINLTAFMDNSRITCIVEDDPTPLYYSYTLSVMYPPQEIGTLNPLLRLNQEYFLPCPLSSHPQPSCSWRALNCFNRSIALNVSDYDELMEDGCQLHIKQATVELAIVVCLQCNATNALGSNTFTYNSLQINFCPSETSIAISPRDKDGKLVITEGDTLNLTCHGYGLGEFGIIIWCFNGTIDNGTCDYSHNGIYDQGHCKKTGTFIRENVSRNDTGIYRCYMLDQYFEEINVLVISKQNNDQGLGTNSLHDTVKSVIVFAALFVVFLVLLISLIATVIWQRSKKSVILSTGFDRLINDENDDDYEYDAFISFAEEDKLITEDVIKKPLECNGYRICWHHDAFIPGYTVNENMEYFVHRSKYTIAMISQSFFKSSYCEKELEIARRKVQKTNLNCLIPVMVEPWDGVPTELLKITYININDKQLLERLTQILGKSMANQDI